MPASDGLVAEIAGAILDGAPIDWASASSTGNMNERALLDELRLLARVASLYRDCPIASPTTWRDADGRHAPHDDHTKAPEEWAHLRVLDSIGRGAFGEVYRAWDTKLDREVALKLLPASTRDGASRSAAIIDEGRLLARVHHPNVVTIFGADCVDDRIGLWMELIKGRTLQQAVEDGQTFGASDVVRIGIELCRAVAAVHEAGLVHRDIKPHNVMLADTGRVVLMDFGTGSELGDGSSAELAGTPLYLAPELLAGHEPTTQSDIYSLGVVLFHLLTGSYPVRAGSLRDLRLAHASGERARLKILRPDAPPKLARIVERAIDPEPGGRYRSAATLATDLASLESRPWRVPLAYAIAGAALGLLLWIGAERRARWFEAPDAPAAAAAPPATFSPAEQLRPIPVTSLPGREFFPAVSPDGSRVAFIWDGGDREARVFQLYVQSLEAAHPLKLTQGPRDAMLSDWSPDGRHLAFLRHPDLSNPLLHEILLVPATGGAERSLGTVIGEQHGLSWSPDGRILAVVDRPSTEAPDSIYLLSVTDGHKQQLTSPPAGFVGDSFAKFSPDGKSLVFLRMQATFHGDVYVIDLIDGMLTRITRDSGGAVSGLDWTYDGNSIIFASGPSAFLTRLWKVAATGGPPYEVGLTDGYSPSTSRRNRAVMVYVRGQFDSNIWRTQGPLATGAVSPPVRFIESTQLDFVPQFSPDRRTIAFLSRRSGTTELWTSNSDGANLTRLTFLEQDDPEMDFAWSPDAREIALTAWAGGNREIHVIPAQGGNPARITTTPAHERLPSFSRDGRWIYFTSRQSGADEIWKVSRAGGSPMQVTRHGGVEAHESSDGRSLYFTKALNYTLPQGIWRTSPFGGQEEMIVDRGFAQQWGVFGDGICYVNVDLRPGSDVFINCHDFKRRSVRRVATLDKVPQVPGFSIASDGQWILFTGTDTNDSDLMMVENFR